MNVHSLRRSEVEYELRIRGVKIEGNADELRKTLNHCFSNNVQVDGTCVAELDTQEELETCQEKLSDLSRLVEEYDGNTRDNEYKRTQARLTHWYRRVERIPVAATSDTEQEERKAELLSKMKGLVESFEELKTKPGNKESKGATEVNKENTDMETELIKTGLGILPTIPRELPAAAESLSFKDLQKRFEEPVALNKSYQPNKLLFQEKFTTSQSKSKVIPVFKWGLKYDGEGSISVAAFLERAEELSRARGVSYNELYESAVDLFTGTALMWYRSAYRRISSWEELKRELKLVFQSPDYDDRLQQEILNRSQGETETLDLYLAAMDGLFGRLSTPVPEEVKLQRILKNLNPFVQDKLCMFDISSLDELRRLGRRAEVGRLRSTTLHPPPRPSGVLEPDLAFSSSRRRPAHGNVAFVRTSPGICSSSSTPRSTLRSLKCWNCGENHHVYRDCTKERKVFCYGCGEAGMKKATCPKCQTKNVQGQGSL